MNDKFVNYSVEDFAQNTCFVNWVNKGTDHKEWEDFVRENPGLSKDIDTAKKIVTALRYNSTNLLEAEVQDTYKNVENFYRLQHKAGRVIRFRRFMKYAAFLILLLSNAIAVSYIYFSRNNNKYTELPVSASAGLKEAKLILSGGEEILLKQKQTDLQFNAAGTQIKIDKDSIINYKIKSDENAMAQIVIPFGKRSNITLSDGTKVWLNAGSKLIFPQKFTGRTRHVMLKGEAYFEVFKNKDIPFIVSMDKMNVTVHGTEFNAKDYDSDSELEVVLVKGAVSLKEMGIMNTFVKESELVPNQRAIFNKTDNSTSIESIVDFSRYTSWKEGLLEFDKQSIVTLFNRLSRFYNVSFETEAGVELNRKISGKLDLKDSLEDVMKVVSDAAPITFRIVQDKVYVNSKINYLPMR